VTEGLLLIILGWLMYTWLADRHKGKVTHISSKSTPIGNLVVTVTADTKDFESSMARIAERLNELQKRRKNIL
jgi:hypothetical protein